MTLRVGLSAVIVAVIDGAPHVLATRGSGDSPDGLPFGPFDPESHRTFELGLRDWVSAQTGFDIGYVEQLYTFGDRGRELPTARLDDNSPEERVISVGYLALTPEATEIGAFDAVFRTCAHDGVDGVHGGDIAPTDRWRVGAFAGLDTGRAVF